MEVKIRGGSVQGSKHLQWGLRNQDSFLLESFSVPAFRKTYHVGLISDGCTGLPGFSRTEIGSGLLTMFSYARIQELVCCGIPVSDVPTVLYPAVTEFIRRLSDDVMPRTIVWPYPKAVSARQQWSSTERFRADVMSATILGLVCDEETTVVFSAGDGIILTNDNLDIIDQKDQPAYPAISINEPRRGFSIKVYATHEVKRLAVMTDGLKKLIHEKEFRDHLFTHQADNAFGLQFLLNVLRNERPEDMEDDCTAVTLEMKT